MFAPTNASAGREMLVRAWSSAIVTLYPTPTSNGRDRLVKRAELAWSAREKNRPTLAGFFTRYWRVRVEKFRTALRCFGAHSRV